FTFPCHQLGLAWSSSLVFGSRLTGCHGPVPMIRVPGLPKVALCCCWNFDSKIPGAAWRWNCHVESGCNSFTTTVLLPDASMLLTVPNRKAACDPFARQ